MAHTLDPAKIEEILETIEEQHLDRLTKWEIGFIESIHDKHDRSGHLSEGELEKLEEIWLKLP